MRTQFEMTGLRVSDVHLRAYSSSMRFRVYVFLSRFVCDFMWATLREIEEKMMG